MTMVQQVYAVDLSATSGGIPKPGSTQQRQLSTALIINVNVVSLSWKGNVTPMLLKDMLQWSANRPRNSVEKLKIRRTRTTS